MKRVLILDGDAAHAVAMMEGLREAGYETAVLCHDKCSYGYRTRLASARFLGPDSSNEEKYLQALSELLGKEHFDAIIPTSDAAALIMSKHKEKLSKLTGMLMPDFETFMNGYDKNRLMALCEKKGYPHPKTVDLSSFHNCGRAIHNDESGGRFAPDLKRRLGTGTDPGRAIHNDESGGRFAPDLKRRLGTGTDPGRAINNDGEETESLLKEFPYPALIKPNLTSGARGMTRVDSYEEFLEKYPKIREAFGDCHLQQLIPEGGRQVKVQAFRSIHNSQFTIHNENGEDSAMHDAKDGAEVFTTAIWKQRYYPVKGGSSCCNVTIREPEVERICASVMDDLGWVGFADFDLIENPLTGELLIMEINPRIPACIRSVSKSGVDYAVMIADATVGRPMREYHFTPGKRLRHLGFDVLWFLKSPERWRAKPSWFKFFGKDIFYQDWVKGNFKAFLYGTIGNIKKMLSKDFREAKGI